MFCKLSAGPVNINNSKMKILNPSNNGKVDRQTGGAEEQQPLTNTAKKQRSAAEDINERLR